MKVTHIEHLGIAVNSLADAVPFFEQILGVACYGVEEVSDQRVRTAFFQVGQTKIELLESTDPEGPVGRFIGKKGEGIHHIAFAVEDVDGALREVGSRGIQMIDNVSRKGAEGLSIGFLHPKSTHGVLMEFCGR